MMKVTGKFVIFLMGIVALTGCDKFLGVDEAPPLPGKRLSILVYEQTLEPDPVTADQKILLPEVIIYAKFHKERGKLKFLFYEITEFLLTGNDA